MLDSMRWLRLGGLAVIVGIVAPEALSEPSLVSESRDVLRWGLRLGSALALGLFACFWVATPPRTMALRSASALVAAQAIAALAISPELMLVLAAELPLIFDERRARGWLVGLALRGLATIDKPFDRLEPPFPLTPRELDVLRLVATGWSNKEIARALQAGEGTVRNHVCSILSKLGVRDRTRAVLRAVEVGYLQA